MKKILTLLIFSLVFVSMAMAIPHPKYRNQKNARISNSKTIAPKPPLIKR